MSNLERQDDKEFMDKLEEFAILKKEFDSQRSLTAVQLFTITIAGLVLMSFLGFITLFFGGLVLGTIFASVISTISILGAIENMRNRNISDLLEVKKYEEETS